MNEGWRSAPQLLVGPLRQLVTGQALGQAADGLAQVTFAQIVLFQQGPGATPWGLAKLLAVTLLPFSLVGPFAGVVIDRWDRRRTLVWVSVGRAAVSVCATGILLLHSQALAYVGVLVLLSSSRFVLVGKGAVLPRTVDRSVLVTANAISSLAGSASAFIGATVASTFVSRVPAAGFVTAAIAYLGAAFSFSRLPRLGGGETRVALLGRLHTVAVELGDGVRLVARLPRVRRPLIAVGAHRLLLGAGFILLVLIANTRYRLETPGYGLALAATGVASLVGTAAAPRLAKRCGAQILLPASFVTAALAALIAGFEPTLGVLVVAVSVVALAFGVLKVVVDALVQQATPDPFRGRVFAAYDVLYNLAFVTAGLALVPLWSPGRERALLRSIAIAYVIAGGVLACAQRSAMMAPGSRPDARSR